MKQNLEKSARPTWKIWVISGVVAVTALTGGTIWYLQHNAIPDPAQNPAAGKKFITSSKFQDLSLKEQQNYLQKLGGPKKIFKEWKTYSPEEQKQLRQTMRRARRAKQQAKMRKFFAADRATQNKMLDADIAQMRQRKAQWERAQSAAQRSQSGAQRPAKKNQYQGRGGFSAQNRRDWEAATDPADRAQRQLYWKRMQERMNGKR